MPSLAITIDVGRAIAHQALGVGADIGLADVVAPDHQDVRLLPGVLRGLVLGLGYVGPKAPNAVAATSAVLEQNIAAVGLFSAGNLIARVLRCILRPFVFYLHGHTLHNASHPPDRQGYQPLVQFRTPRFAARARAVLNDRPFACRGCPLRVISGNGVTPRHVRSSPQS